MITIYDQNGKRPLPSWARDYMLKWIERLILNEWHISAYVNGGLDEDQDDHAAVIISRATQRAVIRYRGDIPEERPNEAAEWEITTIHELLHLRLGNLAYTVIDDILPLLGGQAYQVAYAAFNNNLEQTIELLAQVLHRMDQSGKS
jgi:hypothetical protein